MEYHSRASSRAGLSSWLEWKVNNLQYLNVMAVCSHQWIPELDDHEMNPVGYMDGIQMDISQMCSDPVEKSGNYTREKKHLSKSIVIFDPMGEIVCSIWTWPSK